MALPVHDHTSRGPPRGCTLAAAMPFGCFRGTAGRGSAAGTAEGTLDPPCQHTPSGTLWHADLNGPGRLPAGCLHRAQASGALPPSARSTGCEGASRRLAGGGRRAAAAARGWPPARDNSSPSFVDCSQSLISKANRNTAVRPATSSKVELPRRWGLLACLPYESAIGAIKQGTVRGEARRAERRTGGTCLLTRPVLMYRLCGPAIIQDSERPPAGNAHCSFSFFTFPLQKMQLQGQRNRCHWRLDALPHVSHSRDYASDLGPAMDCALNQSRQLGPPQCRCEVSRMPS